jgi:hypothetical protein
MPRRGLYFFLISVIGGIGGIRGSISLPAGGAAAGRMPAKNVFKSVAPRCILSRLLFSCCNVVLPPAKLGRALDSLAFRARLIGVIRTVSSLISRGTLFA